MKLFILELVMTFPETAFNVEVIACKNVNMNKIFSVVMQILYILVCFKGFHLWHEGF